MKLFQLLRKPRASRLSNFQVLQIETTTACNLDCEICKCRMRPSNRPVVSLSFNDFKKVLDSDRFDFVAFHGWGEPLLNPELFDMIRFAESRGVITQLATNGTLIRDNAQKIISSGLSEIAFGIYTRRAFLQRRSQIEELISTIKNNGARKPKAYLDICIYRNNLEQIPELIQLAAETGFNAVILHRLFNAYGVNPDVEYISEEEEKELFSKVQLLASSLRLELHLPQPRKRPCAVIQHSVFVTAEGKLTPCCFLEDMTVGDALVHGVSKVKHSEAYANRIRSMEDNPICNMCRW